MIYTLVVFFIILGLYFLTSYYFKQVVIRKLQKEDEMFNNQIQRNLLDRDYYKNLRKENVNIKSKEGLSLRGIFIDNGSKNTIIFCHGITVGLICSLKYIRIFEKRGWNILLYDHRRHGQSEGKYSTYGYLEKEDLGLWVNWIIDRKGKNAVIGLHGESMGAATVLQYSDINKHVKFIISDCAFSDLKELLLIRIKEDYSIILYPILYLVLHLSNILARIKAKFNYNWIKPIEAVKRSTIPIMFIHGNKDYFVPWHMSISMYNAKTSGIKRLYIAEGAAHARAIEVDKERYEKETMSFVEEVLGVKKEEKI